MKDDVVRIIATSFQGGANGAYSYASITLDSSGNLYVADTSNSTIRSGGAVP